MEKMNNKVSVIIPVYKVEAYLDRCLSSIVDQTYSNIEIILVDDGSPDKSGELCDKWAQTDDRIIVIHKENGGLSSARNAGIEAATGDFYFFVDSDDWVTKEAISSLVSIAVKTEADIVSGSYIITSERHDDLSVKDNYVVMNREKALEYYLQIGMAKTISDYPAWGKLYKQQLFDTERFPVGQLYEDVATVYKLIKKANKYVKSEQVIYFYYKNNNSITHNKFKSSDLDAIKVGKDLVAESEAENEIIKLLAKQKEIRGYFSCICKMYLYGIDKSVEEPHTIEQMCIQQLRKNYFFLMRSKMPFSRKLILSSIVISPRFTRFVLHRNGRYENSFN